MTSLLTIDPAAVDETVRLLDVRGERRVETAAFWLGDPGTTEVTVVVIPTGSGAEFGPLRLRLTERWMIALDRVCEQRGIVVLGAVHTHPDHAFFSGIDADGFFHAPDCVSVVLPRYGATSLLEAATKWAVFVGLLFGEWRAATWDDVVILRDGITYEVIHLEAPRARP